MKNGCMYRCLDPNCNDATFDINADSCVHCGNTKLQAEHPGGFFDKSRQAFICSHCGEEDLGNGSLPKLRAMARSRRHTAGGEGDPNGRCLRQSA